MDRVPELWEEEGLAGDRTGSLQAEDAMEVTFQSPLQEVVEAVGEDALPASGKVDRPSLGERLWHSCSALKQKVN